MSMYIRRNVCTYTNTDTWIRAYIKYNLFIFAIER